MNINKTIKMIVAAALLAVSFNASAAFIDGEITMSGDFLPTGGTGLADATGIDFIGDDFGVDDATGDFATAGISAGDIGTYNDFTFSPLAAGTEVWSIGGFSFALDAITVVFQNAGFIVLEGTGILSGAGFDDTAGNWNLTANAAGSIFNYSSGTTSVAEPATLALVGLGFIGLAAARRRA
ncbi:MAG: PEP-CTERM sorting domain-containing protein [Gammaproteobacteria bacterium]